MTISAATSAAATISMTAPRSESSAVITRRTAQALSRQERGCAPANGGLRKLAHGLLEDRPSLIAVLGFPLRVEACGAKLVAERRRIRPIEHQTLGRQVLLQSRVQLGDVVALFQAGGIDVLGDDAAHIVRQRLPGAPVGQEPEAVPHVIG